MKKTLILIVLILVTLSISLAGCTPAEPQVIEKVIERTVVVEKEVEVKVEVEKEVVVTATPEPTIEPRPVKKVASNVQLPLSIFREGTEIKGYEYELYKEALNRAGYDVEVVDVAFAGIIAGLQAEKWDMACSSIYITQERLAEMDFSEPFQEDTDLLLSLKMVHCRNLRI